MGTIASAAKEKMYVSFYNISSSKEVVKLIAVDTKLQSESFPQGTADSQGVQKDPKHRNSNDPTRDQISQKSLGLMPTE